MLTNPSTLQRLGKHIIHFFRSGFYFHIRYQRSGAMHKRSSPIINQKNQKNHWFFEVFQCVQKQLSKKKLAHLSHFSSCEGRAEATTGPVAMFRANSLETLFRGSSLQFRIYTVYSFIKFMGAAILLLGTNASQLCHHYNLSSTRCWNNQGPWCTTSFTFRCTRFQGSQCRQRATLMHTWTKITVWDVYSKRKRIRQGSMNSLNAVCTFLLLPDSWIASVMFCEFTITIKTCSERTYFPSERLPNLLVTWNHGLFLGESWQTAFSGTLQDLLPKHRSELDCFRRKHSLKWAPWCYFR